MIKEFTKFLLEYYSNDIEIEKDTQEENIPQIQSEQDIDDESIKIKNIVDLVYNKNNNNWDISDDSLKLPISFNLFDEWINDIKSDNKMVVRKINKDNNKIHYILPLYLYNDFLDAEIESFEKEEEID